MQSLFLRPLGLSSALLRAQPMRAFMPRPGKTHKGAAARFVIASGAHQKGLIFRSRAGAAHLNIKKSSTRRARLKQKTVVSQEQVPAIMRLLGR